MGIALSTLGEGLREATRHFVAGLHFFVFACLFLQQAIGILTTGSYHALGGLSLALALNVYAVARFDVDREDGSIVVTVRVTPGLWNIAIAVVSVLLLVTLVGYAFLENFTYRP